MKEIKQIINQEPVYLNDWENKSDVFEDFVQESDETVNILFASYSDENYVGDAWVLFEQNGKLYEVNGDHCSCFGLEGQWEPEEVLLKELEHRLIRGTFGEGGCSENNFKEELCKFLGVEYL